MPTHTISIENILKLRKGYAIKLYEHFNASQKELDKVVVQIDSEIEELLTKEEGAWIKMQSKKDMLRKFDREIESLLSSKGIINSKRAKEVQTLRSKIEKKYFESNDEYQQLMDHIQSRQHEWKQDLQYNLLNSAKSVPVIQRLHTAVSRVYPDLEVYCQNWRVEPLQRLEHIIKDASNIEAMTGQILTNIHSIQNLTMDEQHLLDIKNQEIPKSCTDLSKRIDAFITNSDYFDILDKTKEQDPFLLDFLKLFKDSGFTSLRASLRLVQNLPSTEKKLITVGENFQHLQLVMHQVLEKLKDKKSELMKVCTNATVFSEETCSKWLNGQYSRVLNLTEKIHLKRNEFMVNDGILSNMTDI